MNEPRVGRAIRALRHRLSWRQEDVARRASLSQDTISRVERGIVDPITVGRLRRIIWAVDAELVLLVRWRGGELDRLLDEGHATIVGWVADVMAALRWDVRIEVSFSVYGERGSIDVLGWHERTAALLVVEVKTELTSVEGTLRRHDAKARLAPRMVEERFGWSPRSISRLLVLPDASTARRRVARNEEIFKRAYPVRGRAVSAWLQAPDGSIGAIVFLSPTHGTRSRPGRIGRKRIRRPASNGGPPTPGSDGGATRP